MGVLYLKCPYWASFTLWAWILTVWCSIFGTVSYISKLYQVNFISMCFIAIGIILPIIWGSLLVVYPDYTNEPTTLKNIYIFSVSIAYISFYCFGLGIYIVIDKSFVLTYNSIVFFYYYYSFLC